MGNSGFENIISENCQSPKSALRNDHSNERINFPSPKWVSWSLNIIVRIWAPVALLKQLTNECRSPALQGNPQWATAWIKWPRLNICHQKVCPKNPSREVATLRREILRRSVARFCDASSRDFATPYLHQQTLWIIFLPHIFRRCFNCPSDAFADVLDVFKVFHKLLVVELHIGRTL